MYIYTYMYVSIYIYTYMYVSIYIYIWPKVCDQQILMKNVLQSKQYQKRKFYL